MQGYLNLHHPLVLACGSRNNSQTSVIYTLLRSDVHPILPCVSEHYTSDIANEIFEHQAKKLKTGD